MDKNILLTQDFIDKIKDLDLTTSETNKLQRFIRKMHNPDSKNFYKKYPLSTAEKQEDDFYLLRLSARMRMIVKEDEDSIILINIFTTSEMKTSMKTSLMNFFDEANEINKTNKF